MHTRSQHKENTRPDSWRLRNFFEAKVIPQNVYGSTTQWLQNTAAQGMQPTHHIDASSVRHGRKWQTRFLTLSPRQQDQLVPDEQTKIFLGPKDAQTDESFFAAKAEWYLRQNIRRIRWLWSLAKYTIYSPVKTRMSVKAFFCRNAKKLTGKTILEKRLPFFELFSNQRNFWWISRLIAMKLQHGSGSERSRIFDGLPVSCIKQVPESACTENGRTLRHMLCNT